MRDLFIKHYRNKNLQKGSALGKVDPNFSSGNAKVILDSDKESGILSSVKWADHIVPASGKSVVVINGVVIAQFDRS